MTRILYILFFCLLNGTILMAQFISTGGPVSGGVFDATYAFGDTAFVDVNSFPWRTFDGGRNWEIVLGDLDLPPNPDAFVRRGDVLYMGTNSADRMYRSLDYGDSWEVFNEGLPRIMGFPAAVPTHLAHSGDRVFAGGTNFGLRYTDLADTAWVRINEGTGGIVFCISVIGEDSILVNQGDGRTNRSYFSADNGDTWTQLGAEPNPLFTLAVTGYGQIGKRLVAVVDAGGANASYYSDDFGDSWTLSNNGPAVSSQLIQPKEDLIFAINFEGIYQTTNGIDWTLIDEVASGRCIAYWKGDQLLYGTNGFGLFDVPSFGDGAFQQQPFAVAYPKDLQTLGDRPICLTDLGLYILNGSSWELLSDLTAYIQDDLFNPGYFFDVVQGDDGLYLCANSGYYKSTDNGKTFEPIDFFQGQRVEMARKTADFEIVMVSAKPNDFVPQKNVAKAYYWDEGSSSYKQASVDGSVTNLPYVPKFFIAFNGQLYLSNGTKQVFVSADNGQSWSLISLAVNVGSMFAFDGKLFFNGFGWPTGKVYYTENGFSTNTEISLSSIPRGNEFLDWWYFEEIFVVDDKLYVYQNDPVMAENMNGFYYLDAADADWTYVEDSELPAPPNFLLGYQSTLMAGVPNWSVWSNGALTSSLENPAYTETSSLAFPNPVTAILQIVNPKGERWELYDLRGQLLMSGQSQQADLSDLPPALYLLKMGMNVQKVLKN